MDGFFTYAGYYFVFLLLWPYVLTLLKLTAAGLKSYFTQNSPKWTEKYGMWAVVTGSTDGIGKAYSKQLARKGMNIVLISRNQERLDKTASEIRNKFNVQIKTVKADFNDGPSVYEHIEQELCGLEIGVLVNNVGICTSVPTPFHVMSSTTMWEQVQVNVGSTLFMTKLILPQMQKRNRGAIINLSSIVEKAPWPRFSVYAATKAFITHFVYALQFENRHRDITIQIVSPSFTKTPLATYASQLEVAPDAFMPTAEIFARQAIETLGCSPHTIGYWPHCFQALPMDAMSLYGRTWVAGLTSAFIRKLCKTDIKKR